MPVSQPLTAETLQALSSQGLVKSGGMTADGKRIIVVKKSATGILSRWDMSYDLLLTTRNELGMTFITRNS